MSYKTTVSSKGWVVIPRELRERYNIIPGSKVLFMEMNKGLGIVPLPPNPVKTYRGMLQKYPLVQELIKARKEESAREELRARQLRRADLLPE